MPRKKLPEKLDCYTKVVTPENIQFEYALAGPFQRLPAYIADVIIWNLAFWGFAFALLMIVGMIGLPSIAEVGLFVGFIVYFLLSWFYAVFFEAYYNGRTPGKALFRLRAVGIDGRPINGVQSGLRNLLRLADINIMLSLQILVDDAPPYPMFPTLIVGLVTMLVSSKMQRVGDLAAGTMVISESRKYSPWNLQPEDLRAFGLAELIPHTFEISSSLAQTVGLYMENRRRLGLARREEIAGKIAKPLIRKFEMLPNTGCDLLMCAMYVRIFLSEAQQQQGIEAMRRSVDPSMRPVGAIPYPGTVAKQSTPYPGTQYPGTQYPGTQYPASPYPTSQSAPYPGSTQSPTQHLSQQHSANLQPPTAEVPQSPPSPNAPPNRPRQPFDFE